MEANATMYCHTAERIRLLEETIRSYEERNYELEENEIELRDRLEFMERLLPAVILWNLFSKTEKPTHSARPLCLQSSKLNNFDPEVTRRVQERIQAVEDKINRQCECNPNPLKTPESILELNYVAKLKALSQTETEVRSRMEALEQKERAYFETLNQYDAIFAAMEADFNQKLATSQASEEELRSQIQKLESESRCSCSSDQNSDVTKFDEDDDVDDLTLHNNRLEESIRALRCRLHSLEHDKRKQAERMNSELEACRTRVHDVLENVEGPLKKQLERANCRVNQLTAEIADSERQMRLMADEYEEQRNPRIIKCSDCECSITKDTIIEKFICSNFEPNLEVSREESICYCIIENEESKKNCETKEKDLYWYQSPKKRRKRKNKSMCPIAKETKDKNCSCSLNTNNKELATSPMDKTKEEQLKMDSQLCVRLVKTGPHELTLFFPGKISTEEDTSNKKCPPPSICPPPIEQALKSSKQKCPSQCAREDEINMNKKTYPPPPICPALSKSSKPPPKPKFQACGCRAKPSCPPKKKVCPGSKETAKCVKKKQGKSDALNDRCLKMFQLKSRIGKLSRELQHTECNNGELREEVETLEAAVAELKQELDRQTEEHAKERSELLANQTELKAEIESLQEQSLAQNNDEASMRLSDELAAAVKQESDHYVDEPHDNLDETTTDIEEPEENIENSTSIKEEQEENIENPTSIKDEQEENIENSTSVKEEQEENIENSTSIKEEQEENIEYSTSIKEEQEENTENRTSVKEESNEEIENSEPMAEPIEIKQEPKESIQTTTVTTSQTTSPALSDSMNDLMDKLNIALIHLTECDSCKNLVGPTLEAILGDLSVVALEIDHTAPPGLPPVEICCFEPKCITEINQYRKEIHQENLTEEENDEFKSCGSESESENISLSNCSCVKEKEISTQKNCNNKKTASDCEKLFALARIIAEKQTNCSSKNKKMSKDAQLPCCCKPEPPCRKPPKECGQPPPACCKPPPCPNPPPPPIVTETCHQQSFSNIPPIKIHHYELSEHETLLGKELADLAIKFQEQDKKNSIQCTTCRKHLDIPEDIKKEEIGDIKKETEEAIEQIKDKLSIMSDAPKEGLNELSEVIVKQPEDVEEYQPEPNEEVQEPNEEVYQEPNEEVNQEPNEEVNQEPNEEVTVEQEPVDAEESHSEKEDTQQIQQESSGSEYQDVKQDITDDESEVKKKKVEHANEKRTCEIPTCECCMCVQKKTEATSTSCLSVLAQAKPVCCRSSHCTSNQKSSCPPPPPPLPSCCKSPSCARNIRECLKNCLPPPPPPKFCPPLVPRIPRYKLKQIQKAPCQNNEPYKSNMSENNSQLEIPKSKRKTSRNKTHSSLKEHSQKSHSCCHKTECPANVRELEEPMCCKMLQGKKKSNEKFVLPAITSTPKRRDKSPPCWNPKLNNSMPPPPPPKKFTENECEQNMSQSLPSSIPSPPPMPSYDQDISRPKTTNNIYKDTSTDYLANRSQSACSCRSKNHNTTDFSTFIQAMTKRKENMHSTKHDTSENWPACCKKKNADKISLELEQKESYNDCDFPQAPPPPPPPFPCKPANKDSLNSKKPSCYKINNENKIKKCTSTSTSTLKLPACCKKNVFDQSCCKKYDKHPSRNTNCCSSKTCPRSLGIKATDTVITPYTKVVSNGKTLDMSYILPIPPPPVITNSRKYSNCKPESRESVLNSGPPPKPPPMPSSQTYFHQRTVKDLNSSKPCCEPNKSWSPKDSNTSPPTPPPIPEILKACCEMATCPFRERRQSKSPIKDKSKCCSKLYCPSKDTTVMPILISYTIQNEKKLMDSRNRIVSFKKKEVKSQGVSVALNRHEFGDIPSIDSVSRVVFRCDPEDICRLDD